MGAKCSTGMADGLKANTDPIYTEVHNTLSEMVPLLLAFQVSGEKKEFEEVEKYVMDNDSIFVYSSGKFATAKEISNTTGKSAFAKAELVSINNIRLFADKNAAVATITVQCGYEMTPGTYNILRNTYTMASSSMKSQQVTDLDKDTQVEVDRVVRVGERLRGKLKNKNEWITLENSDSPDTKFVESVSQSGKGEQMYTYTTVMERVEANEGEYAWKLLQLTMQGQV